MVDEELAPSRDQFRSKRQQRRSALRRRLLGVPLILLGIGMMVAGTWVWLDDGDSSPEPTVAGTTQVSVSTTTVAEVGLIPPATETNPESPGG